MGPSAVRDIAIAMKGSAYLGDTKQSPDDVELGMILDSTSTGGNGCPSEHPRSHPDRWSDLLTRHDQVTGNLH